MVCPRLKTTIYAALRAHCVLSRFFFSYINLMTKPNGFNAWAFALLVACTAASAADEPPSPQLQTSSELARAGYYQLAWEWTGGAASGFELQESSGESFGDPRGVYRGGDLATQLSGRADGVYHYRVRAHLEDGRVSPWSEVVSVTVDHYPLSWAFGFFGVGALVFVVTLVTIIRGARRGEARARP